MPILPENARLYAFRARIEGRWWGFVHPSPSAAFFLQGIGDVVSDPLAP
jgi:hypothetical protein